MPMEFLLGRPLSPEELEMIRHELESMVDIGVVMTKSEATSLATGHPCGRSFRAAARGRVTVVRKPLQQPPQVATWRSHKLAAKQVRIGEVKAADEREAVEEAAREFGQHARILTLTGRRSWQILA